MRPLGCAAALPAWQTCNVRRSSTPEYPPQLAFGIRALLFGVVRLCHAIVRFVHFTGRATGLT